jgi:hypothetical protein
LFNNVIIKSIIMNNIKGHCGSAARKSLAASASVAVAPQMPGLRPSVVVIIYVYIYY